MKRIASLKCAHRVLKAVNRRRGSTIVVVLALLVLLTFTGFVFFTFAAQENEAEPQLLQLAYCDRRCLRSAHRRRRRRS